MSELEPETADELHLHRYDLHLAARSGETTVLSFVAKRTGRFGFELHRGRHELGAFEVYP